MLFVKRRIQNDVSLNNQGINMISYLLYINIYQRMFKSQLPISLAVLLALTGGASARFLQPSNTTKTNSTAIIAPKGPLSIPYVSNLTCGECILSGYVFCVNGPEQFSGVAPLKTTCCKDSSTCKQASDKAWSCSSKYANLTLVDQLKVCPFDSKQCGSQDLSLDELGDAQCLRLKSLKKGSACLFRVQSKCATPQFKLNDTSSNLFVSSLMLSNRTIQYVQATPSGPCTEIRNQSCVCRSTSNSGYQCDCETELNINLNSSACKQCTVFKDSNGNELRQCQCSMISPAQAYQDQECQCQRVTDMITKKSSLNCTCSKPVPAKAVTLPESQCKCVNSFNPSNQQNFLACVCNDAPVCPDPQSLKVRPVTPPAAPCKISYPCSCAAIRLSGLVFNRTQGGNNSASQNLSCQCTNPSTSLSLPVSPISSTQCQCQSRFTSNSTWEQSCNCCLNEEFVRTKLIPPVTCSSPQSMKQSCLCNNVTVSTPKGNVFRQDCNCTHPSTKVTVGGVIYQNDTACDCENVNLGNKSCSCCVPNSIQAVQLQPVCSSNASIESCRCESNGKNETCACDSKKFNFTFPNMTVGASSCYCAPANQSSVRACNCCVSEPQFQQVPQTCFGGKQAAQCKCQNITTVNKEQRLVCDCSNRFFFNSITPQVTLNPQVCACFRPASVPALNSTTTGGNSTLNTNKTNSTNATQPSSVPVTCSCCTELRELAPIPRCQNGTSFVNCNNCYNYTNPLTKQNEYRCNCNGSHVLEAKNPVVYNNFAVNVSTCACNTFTATCDCCIDSFRWSPAAPVCNSSNFASESCQCKNESIITTYNRTAWRMENRTENKTCRKTGCSGEICSANVTNTSCSLWKPAFACYQNATCQYQASTGDCGWTPSTAFTNCTASNLSAFANATLRFQNVTNRTVTTTPVIRSVNVSFTEFYNITTYRWGCNCPSSKYPNVLPNIKNAPVTPQTCGCNLTTPVDQNQTCQCCISKQRIDELYLSALTCNPFSNTQVTNCTCDDDKNCDCFVNRTHTFKNPKVSQCNCLDYSNQTRENCTCCVNKDDTDAMTKPAPVCSYGQNTKQCECDANFRCTCFNGTVLVANNYTFNETKLENVTVPVLNKTTNITRNVTSLTNVTRTRTITNFTQRSIYSLYPLTSKQCSCLTITNGTSSSRSLCNCCTQEALQCNLNTTAAVQNCSCQNITAGNTWRWSCSCTRRDNNFRGNLTFTDKNACQCNATDSSCQCCVNKEQFNRMYPVLTCPSTSQTQPCQCTASTDLVTKKSQLTCNCFRNETGIRGTFKQDPASCLCNITNSTNCSCCVSPDQFYTQIPRAQCASNLTPLYCSGCTIQTTNVTVNGTATVNVTVNGTTTSRIVPNITTTRVTTQVCQCQRSDFLFSQALNFTQNNTCVCLNNGTNRCECCLSSTQMSSLIPQVQCNAVETPATGCNCSNVTDGLTVNQTCDCKFKFNFQDYTVRNLTTRTDKCLCNTTTCGCCLAPQKVEAATEKFCLANETRSTCSCTGFNSSLIPRQNVFNCSCSTFAPKYVIQNASYTGLTGEQCLCRSPSNCTCCLGSRFLPAPTQPVCSANVSEPLPSCKCDQLASLIITTNTTTQVNVSNSTNKSAVVTTNTQVIPQYKCDCARTSNASVEFYYNDLTLSTCNCLNVSRPSGLKNRECSCCGTSAQVAIPQPPTCALKNSTVESCLCQNVTDKLTNATVQSCNCRYQRTNTTIFGLTSPQCGCSLSNSTVKNCQCCVTVQQYRDAVTPTCSANDTSSLATCQCSPNQTLLNARPALRCSCVGDLKQSNTTVFNDNMTVTASQCGCYNDEFGRYICKCCLKDQLAQPPQRTCNPATQIVSACECQPGNSTNATKNCSCQSKQGIVNYFLGSFALNSSDCGCIDATTNGKTVQQCNCCTNRTVLSIRPPTCNLTSQTSQQCDCRLIFNATLNATQQVCDCTRRVGNVQQTRMGLIPQPGSCQCLNQTVGDVNGLNCTCCIDNPPLTLCEQLSVTNTSVLDCKCNDVVINGRSTFSCDCGARVNATTTLTKSGMLFDESKQCCCVEKIDSLTKKGFKACNCTQPPVPQQQNCTCRPVGGALNATQVQCECSDCNRAVQTRTLPTSKCACPAFNNPAPKPVPVPVMNNTNTTTSNSTRVANQTSGGNATNKTNGTTGVVNNTTVKPQPIVAPPSNYSCSCQVDFAGFCPMINMKTQVDENTCDASNRLSHQVKSFDPTCKYQYEYFVAVVATGKDASVLLQLQSYQMTQQLSGVSLRASFSALLLAVVSVLFFY